MILTGSKFYIVTQHLANKQVQISIERAISNGAIKFVGTSTCQDDWFSLGIGSAQEADPLLNCVLKTELFTHMQGVMPGGFNLKISDSIEYAKKPNKMQVIKVVKDSTMRADFYKSGAIHTSQGEPPNSQSYPMPKGKPIPAKPFTKGRLIKPGGPGGRPSKLSNGNRNTKPAAQPSSQSYGSPAQAPAQAQARNVPQPVYGQSRAQPAPTPISNHTRNASSTSSARAVPPPPPAAVPQESRYRVLYDFSGQSANELTLRKDDIVTVEQKENNGMTLGEYFFV